MTEIPKPSSERAERFRALADAADALALEVPASRKTYNEIALRWRRLADEAEAQGIA